MRCVLGLFEGVVTGAADGYARVTGKPAATLLHCGPGLANGLANLHNARRASTPIVNIVGDQATYHRPLDPPLTADTEGWARGVSGWVRTAMDVADRRRATPPRRCRRRMIAPGQIATLILPVRHLLERGRRCRRGAAAAADAARRAQPDRGSRRDPAPRRRRASCCCSAAAALSEEGLALAHRIAAATGCRLVADTAPTRRSPRGQGRAVAGAGAVCGRRRGRGHGGHQTTDPVRGAQAGDVLRLSGQAADLDPGRRRDPCAGAPGAGSDRGAGAAGRRAAARPKSRRRTTGRAPRSGAGR